MAAALDDVAELLDAREESVHRVRAYRRAADLVRRLDRSVARILEDGGREALEDLPRIGSAIAAAIDAFLRTGRIPSHERLLARTDPAVLFRVVPGVGPRLARRARDALGLRSLADLEAAAHDGRLEGVAGFGPRRVRAIVEVLSARLGREARRRAAAAAPGPRPSVGALLAVDERYRRLAAAGRLRRIAPRRFNPTHEAWLPVMTATEGGWTFTVLHSNTALAHRLGRTRDWVVLYAHDGRTTLPFTVVTETSGPLSGRRVVRGRERECETLLARGDRSRTSRAADDPTFSRRGPASGTRGLATRSPRRVPGTPFAPPRPTNGGAP